MKYHSLFIILGLIASTLFLNGCIILPAATCCKGTVSIQYKQPDKQEVSDRVIIASIWEYPGVNNSSGKVDINKVFVPNKQEFALDFALKGYWVVWTPALGTQHLAPDPVIIVFHKDYPLDLVYGSTGKEYKIFCAKPETEQHFSIMLDDIKQPLAETQKYQYRIFFEKFIKAKQSFIRKMNNCKGITDEEKKRILEKIEAAKRMLEKTE